MNQITNYMNRLFVILIMAVNLSACNIKTDHTMSTTQIFPQGEPLPKEWFTGNAFLKPLVAKDKNNDFSAGSVTFCTWCENKLAYTS